MGENLEHAQEKSVGQVLDGLIRRKDFDAITKLPGIEKIDDRENWKKDGGYYTCTSYAFGRGKYVDWEINDQQYLHPKGYTETQSPQEGDIVFYFRDGSPVHVGIYAGGGKADSKFGTGHVYRHPISSVPTDYGTPRFFHRDAR